MTIPWDLLDTKRESTNKIERTESTKKIERTKKKKVE